MELATADFHALLDNYGAQVPMDVSLPAIVTNKPVSLQMELLSASDSIIN
jgi:hypothetical protein